VQQNKRSGVMVRIAFRAAIWDDLAIPILWRGSITSLASFARCVADRGGHSLAFLGMAAKCVEDPYAVMLAQLAVHTADAR
jgi:hypothetical protein